MLDGRTTIRRCCGAIRFLPGSANGLCFYLVRDLLVEPSLTAMLGLLFTINESPLLSPTRESAAPL